MPYGSVQKKLGGEGMRLIKEHIFELEKELLKSEIRKSSEKIIELLDENFSEFCSSGVIYNYTCGDTFQSDHDSQELDWEIRDFEIIQLSEYIVLATYKLIKHSGADEKARYSLRSSVWKYSDGSWKILFHQGTLTSKF